VITSTRWGSGLNEKLPNDLAARSPINLSNNFQVKKQSGIAAPVGEIKEAPGSISGILCRLFL
jgi:hypothetical protein